MVRSRGQMKGKRKTTVGTGFDCSLCKKSISMIQEYHQHNLSLKHMKNRNKVMGGTSFTMLNCFVCRSNVRFCDWKEHLKTRNHGNCWSRFCKRLKGRDPNSNEHNVSREHQQSWHIPDNFAQRYSPAIVQGDDNIKERTIHTNEDQSYLPSCSDFERNTHTSNVQVARNDISVSPPVGNADRPTGNNKRKPEIDDIIDAPAAKRRIVEPCSREDLQNAPSSSQSDEIARMQIALDLTVQEEALKAKIKNIQSHIDEHLAMIQELEVQKEKLLIEEREIYDCRMEILKEMYKGENEPQTSTQTPAENKDHTLLSNITTTGISDNHNTCSTVERNHFGTTERLSTVSVGKTSFPTVKTPTVPDMKTHEVSVVKTPVVPDMRTLVVPDVKTPIQSGMKTPVSSSPVNASIASHVKMSPEAVVKTPASLLSRAHSLDKETANIQVINRQSMKQDIPELMLIDLSSDDSKEDLTQRNETVTSSTVHGNPPVKTINSCWSSQACKGQVYDMKICGDSIVICDEEGLRRYALYNAECLMNYIGFQKSVKCFTTPCKVDTDYIVSGGDDNYLFIHNFKSGILLKTIHFNSTILTLKGYSKGCFIGLSDGQVMKYNVESSAFEWGVMVSDVGVSDLKMILELKLLVGTTDGKLSHMNMSDGKELVTFGEINQALDSWNSIQIRDTLYVIDGGNLKEISMQGNLIKKPRAFQFKIIAISRVRKSIVLVFGCEDGMIRLCDPMNSGSRILVINTRNESSIVSLIVLSSNQICARDKEGKILMVKIPETSRDCEVAGCNLSFENNEEVINHVFRDHVLNSKKKRRVKCLWNKECTHRLSKDDQKGVEAHIRGHLLA